MTIDATLNKRLRRVVRKHDKMRTNGVVHRVGRDGLIRSRPRLMRLQFPFKGVVIVFALLVAFKTMLIVQNGAGNHAAQVETLRAGTVVERAGAFIMQEDPLTTALAGFIKPYFFNL
ncbi:hypothetical protein N9O61_01080 [Octadecabacter sp.]|nr:hypothetical protein [Octadecabacter sp.]